jgi:pimeloyl-ACP methyl ester carboxylesterase
MWSTRPARLATAVATVAAAVLIPIGAASAAGESTGAAPSAVAAATKPTIVLVPGAWANSSSWSGEVTRLQAAGFKVQVAPNPLRGLTSDSAYLKDYLSTVSGPIILAGHSYGGSVITNAALGNKNVKALVYIDAYIPDKGQTAAQLSGGKSALAPASKNPKSVFRLVPYPGAPAKVVDTYLLHSVFLKDFAPDLPTVQANRMSVSQNPASLAALGQPSGSPAWKTIPSWSLIGTNDRIIPEAAQMAMAKHAGAHVETVDSSHVSLISHPATVTALLERVANEKG